MVIKIIGKRLRNSGFLASLGVALSAGMFFGFASGTLLDEQEWGLGLFFIGLWGMTLSFLQAGCRCTEDEAALPLATEALWTVHVAATLISGLALLLAAFGPSVLLGSFERAGDAWYLFFSMMVALIAMLGMVQYIYPALGRLRAGRELVMTFLTGLFFLMVVLKVESLLVLALIALLGIVLLALARRRVPTAYLMVQDATEDYPQLDWLGGWRVNRRSRTVADSLADGIARGGSGVLTVGRRPVLKALLRTFPARISTALMIFLALAGLYLARGRLDYSLLLRLFVLVISLILVLLPEMVRGISPLAHLPVPRRSLFAATVIPVLLLLAVSIGIGKLLNWSDQDYRSRVRIVGDGVPDIQVRKPFWRVAWDGRPEEVVAPDGERHIPTAHPIVGWSRAVIYNPYEVGRGNTEDFAAYQYSRAYHDIYGGNLAPVFAKIHHIRKPGDWPYRQQPPLPPRDGRWNRVAAGLVIFGLIWLLAMLLQTLVAPLVSGLRWFRMARWLRRLAAPLFGLLILGGTLIIVLVRSRPGEMVSALGLIQLQRLPGLLPASAPLAIAAALAVLAMVYMAGQEIFARREIVMGGGVVNELNG